MPVVAENITAGGPTAEVAALNNMRKVRPDHENTGISVIMENSVNVRCSLNRCGDTDLLENGCCISAGPVLRKGPFG